MQESISDNEIDAFLDDLSKAQADGGSWGYLRKGTDAMQNIVNLDYQTNDIAQSLGGRAVYHIDRLLVRERSAQENEFGRNLVKYSMGLMKRLKDSQKIRNIVSGEGYDCCLWWTLSPYIYEILYPEIGAEKAIKLLLLWARTGKPATQVYLSGLQRYNYTNECSFTLGPRSEGFSHQFAKKEALRLVSEVFKRNLA